MYLAMALVVAIPIGFLHTEVRWQWKWHAAGAVAVLIAAVVGTVLWRRRKAWDGVLVRRRAATSCPECGYDLIDVMHPQASPGIPGQVARCPECGRGVRYIEADPEMEDLARAHSRRNDAATEQAIAPTRTDIDNAISGGENASV